MVVLVFVFGTECVCFRAAGRAVSGAPLGASAESDCALPNSPSEGQRLSKPLLNLKPLFHLAIGVKMSFFKRYYLQL